MIKRLLLSLSWLILHIAVVLLLCYQTGDLPTLFTLYTLPYKVVLLAIVLGGPVGAFVIFRPPATCWQCAALGVAAQRSIHRRYFHP